MIMKSAIRICSISLLVAVIAVLVSSPESRASDAKENFAWYCVQCHGVNGGGDGINSVDELPVGPMNLTKSKEMNKFSGEMIIGTLTHGGPKNTLDSLMPPWGNTFTSAEIKALMLYVRSLCKDADCRQD